MRVQELFESEAKLTFVPDPDDQFKWFVKSGDQQVGSISKLTSKGGGFDLRMKSKGRRITRTLTAAKKVAIAAANNNPSLLPAGYSMPS
jgi:hypothetical protein